MIRFGEKRRGHIAQSLPRTAGIRCNLRPATTGLHDHPPVLQRARLLAYHPRSTRISSCRKDHRLAQIKGPEYIRRRLSELVVDPEDNNPDLLEKAETREQVYLVKMVDEINSTKDAYPLKITGYEDKPDNQDV